MPITVVVGGQFGGEGKGKVAHFLAKEMSASIAIRVGGTNSGHTVIDPQTQRPLILRQLPTAAILPNVTCVLGAGTYINPTILFEEITQTGLSYDRLLIDPNAMIVTEQDIREEKSSLLRKSIGSTLSGTGAAIKRRISRDLSVQLAKDYDQLQQFIRPAIPFLRNNLSSGGRIIIEGTQGFGLSLLHSPYYPYTTSRDTTSASFVAEAGLSPMDVDDIVLVIRTFPIRVGGNSGPLPYEIDWETITEESKSPTVLHENTSVTKTTRRVARFDAGIVLQAIMANHPTQIVMNHLDYIDPSDSLADKTVAFIEDIELLIKNRLNYIGFGPASLINRTFIASEVRVK
jgi:adenylosuccinate synthase